MENKETILMENIENLVQPQIDVTCGTIAFDLNDFKDKLEVLTAQIKTAVMTEDTVKQFTNMRAALNKAAKSLNDDKIKIKKKYCNPYLVFENQAKECIGLLKDASEYIDKQVKEYELEQLEILKEDYKQMWEELGKADFVPYEKIEKPNWYLKATSKKQVSVEMNQINEEINKNLSLLRNSIPDDDEYKAMANKYYDTMDVVDVLAKYTEMKNIIKPKTVIVEKVVEAEKTEEPEPITEGNIPAEPIVEDVKPAAPAASEEDDEPCQVIINFISKKSIVENIEKYLKESNVEYFIRKNKVR